MREHSEEEKEAARKRLDVYLGQMKYFKLDKDGNPTTEKGLVQYVECVKILGDIYSVLDDEENLRKYYTLGIQTVKRNVDRIRAFNDNDKATRIRSDYTNIYKGFAPYNFHSYLNFMEFNYDKSRRFYQDRFCVLGEWAKELEKLEYGEYDLLGISAPPRTGKAQPLYSKVLTPTGWKTMGEIKVGDEVIAADGHSTKVTDVFPQGAKPTYRVCFQDGTHADCAIDHLWEVYENDEVKVLRLKDMLEAEVAPGHPAKLNGDYRIDLVAPVSFTGARRLRIKTRRTVLARFLKKCELATLKKAFACVYRCDLPWDEYAKGAVECARSLGYLCTPNVYNGRIRYLGLSKCKQKRITRVERLDDTECQCIVVEDPRHCYVTDGYTLTHNSGIETFYMTWLLGRHPEKSILFATHTNGMAEKIRDDVYSILTDEKRGWSTVFPGLYVDKSAERNWIDINPKSYPNNYKSIYFRGIDQSMAGVLEASHMIVCDDLIRGIEEAMNPARLESAWQKYATDISQRRTSDQVKELHIATRWSINDPLTRLEDLNRDNPRAKFIVVPGLNEKGESNFMYKNHPMTKEHFERLREHMDEVSFECIVQQNPMERDGIVFPKDSLSYYEGELPDGEPDEVVFAADVAFGGGDFTSMPIGYVYGNDVFIHDVVHSDGAKETVKPMICKAIIDNQCTRGFFESNNGGLDYAGDIDSRLKKFGYRCHIESKFAPNTKSKLARILDCESEIKGRITDGSGYVFHFLSPKARAGKPMYDAYIKQLCRFNQTAKLQGKQHDDAADATASLVYNVLNHRRVSGSVQLLSRKLLNF